MSTAEEATVNPDGSTTFDSPPGGGEGFDQETFDTPPLDEDTVEEVAKGVDPAIYLIIAVVVFIVVYIFFVKKKKEEEDADGFFSNLDGDKFNLSLPSEVEDYYQIKEKVMASGWKPGTPPPAQGQGNQSGPHRVMAQALMKRAIADIPIVTFIQKESPGMNKLYAQSMCSVNQWRSYQNAEAMVSAEVEEVRTEADEVEPGWSQVIWRQAMQYHQVLKQKHEAEAKAAEEQAKKRKEIEMKVQAAKAAQEVDAAKAKELAAEKAAEELIKAEEREKQSKKAFSSGGMKKGFLDKGKKK